MIGRNSDAGLSRFLVTVPEGKSGDWKISKVTVSQEDADIDKLRALFNPQRAFRYCPAGEYTRLSCNGAIIMSDTPDEVRDHMPMIHEAKGNILIMGLGVGLILQACLRKPEVKHATVIEQSADVINLVATHYLKMFGTDRLSIINADALTWKPPEGVRYNAVWHDIWDSICGGNLPDMKRLQNRYKKISDWQGIWCYRDTLQTQRETKQKQKRWGNC
jgi:hypothetical protein